MKLPIALCQIAWLALTFALTSSAVNAQALRFAVLPEESAVVSQTRFAPLLRYLESRGLTAVWIPMSDQAALVDAVASKRVDFAWLNGFTFIQTRARMGGNLTPIAQRVEDTQFRSVIVAKVDGVKTVSEITGKRLLFGPATSATGHLMPRHFLSAQTPAALQGTQLRHAASHEAVVYQLLAAQADVGALNEAVWNKLRAEGRIDLSQLQVIFTTPIFVDYCFAIPADRDPALVTALQNALIGLNPRDADHREILQTLRATRLVSASSENYSALDFVARESGLIKSAIGN